MQVVVSLNPAIDVEWRVEGVRWEEKNQVLAERRWPGGKGINVARWLGHLGGDPRLLIPLGSANGQEIARGLRRLSIPFTSVRLAGSSRANVVITTAAGRQLRFNPLGPVLTASEWRSVIALAEKLLRKATILICSGALPRGVPQTAYAELLRLAHKARVPAIVDCDGEALEFAVKERPFLVKPNEFELEQWRRKPLSSEASVWKAARALSRVTGGLVLVSRGSKGALLAGPGVSLQCSAPPARVRNTIGAGDALLAAAATQIEQGAPPSEWLRRGVAAGTAATECPAGGVPSRKRIEEIRHKTVVTAR